MSTPLPVSSPPTEAGLTPARLASQSDAGGESDIVLSTGLASPRSYIGQPGYPLSLLFASSVAAERGLRVRILDFYRAPKTTEALAAYAATRPAPLWGITGNVTDRFELFEAARVVKQACPGIFVVLGGMFASHCARHILDDIPSVDAVVCGEGEHALVELHQAVVSGGDLGAIQGLCWRDQGVIRQNPARPPTRDLDTLPSPRHDLLDLTNYFNLSSRYFPKPLQKEMYGTEPVKVAELMFGRGCPFNCIFCASKNHFYGTFRIVSPERAVEQLEWFYERGYRLFVFWDDHLLLNKRWFESFSALILEKKLRFVFKMSSRIDAITEPIARRLKELGCYMICLGVEYGDDEVLRQIGKGITQDQIENAVRILVEAGIRPLCRHDYQFPDGNAGQHRRQRPVLQAARNVVDAPEPLSAPRLYLSRHRDGKGLLAETESGLSLDPAVFRQAESRLYGLPLHPDLGELALDPTILLSPSGRPERAEGRRGRECARPDVPFPEPRLPDSPGPVPYPPVRRAGPPGPGRHHPEPGPVRAGETGRRPVLPEKVGREEGSTV